MRDVISGAYISESAWDHSTLIANSSHRAPVQINLDTGNINLLHIAASRRRAKILKRCKPELFKQYEKQCDLAEEVERGIRESSPVTMPEVIYRYLSECTRILVWNGQEDLKIVDALAPPHLPRHNILNVSIIGNARDLAELIIRRATVGSGKDAPTLFRAQMEYDLRKGTLLNLTKAHAITCNQHHGSPHEPLTDCRMLQCLLHHHPAAHKFVSETRLL
jgi:hypothetical protein